MKSQEKPFDATQFPEDSAGALASDQIVTARGHETLEQVLAKISQHDFKDINFVFVLEAKQLIGVVHLAKAPRDNLKIRLDKIMFTPRAVVSPHDNRDKVIYLAVRHNVSVVPVVDKQGMFIGAIPAHRLIKAMHVDHLDEAMLVSGVHSRGTHAGKLATAHYGVVLKSRLPWLLFGATAGLGLGAISSLFEKTLSSNMAIAYFVPVVAYIADSVGTQAEAIAVRSLAIMKLSARRYIIRELVTGGLLGLILGVLSGFGAGLISHSSRIGVVVGLSLLAASTIASVLAATIPISLKKLGKDPALGSGPLATALQDILSVLLYFIFATLIMSF